MKKIYSIALFLCSIFFVSNVQAATWTYKKTQNIYSGTTQTHSFSLPASGSLVVKVTCNSPAPTILFSVKQSGTNLFTAATSTSYTSPTLVASAGSCSVVVEPLYINPQYNVGTYTVNATLTYSTNSAPVISSISASPSSTTYGNSVTVNVSATDVNNNLSYVKFTKGSSSVNDTTSPYSQVYSGLGVGTHSVTAYAVDTNAASDDASVSFTVNKRPISVKANSGTSIFGASPSNPGLSLTSGSMAYSQSLAGIGLSNSFAITSSTPVGSYTLNVNGSPSNYAVTKTAGVWVVQSGNIKETDTDGDGIDDNMERTLCGNLTTLTATNLTKSDADGDLYSNIVERLGGASDGSFTSGSNWGSNSAPGAGYSGLTLITPTGIVLSINASNLTVN